MLRITGKQCRAARGLLQWNIQDLVTHMRRNIKARRIESFERGGAHMLEWELQEIHRTFKQHDVIFRADLSVAFKEDEAELIDAESTKQGDGARVIVGEGDRIISDSTLKEANELEEAEEEEKEKDLRKAKKKQLDK